MSLEEKIMADLKDAMRAKDTDALNAIRSIKAALLLAKTDGSGDEMTEEKEIKLLQKLAKQRKDSLAIFEQQGREDLAVVERAELKILEKYLPQQMGEAELEGILKEIIAQLGATSVKDMGKVMGAASKQLAGKADGQAISTLVKKLLGA